MDLAPAQHEWAQIGVLCREDVAAARVLDAGGARRFAKGAAVSTDFQNLFQMRAPYILHRPLSVAEADRVWEPFDPLLSTPRETDLVYFVRRLIRQGDVRRAGRLARTLTDPVIRQTAVGLTELAAGRERAAGLALRQAVQRDPQSEEAVAGLLHLHQAALTRGQSFSFTAQLGDSPAAAVLAGWRMADDAWQELRRLETQLAEIAVRHPLFVAATRLRARWRVASGESDLSQEALDLLEPLQAPTLQLEDLMLQARAGATVGQPQIALAAIREALPRLQRQPDRLAEVRQLLLSLDSVTVEDGTVKWRNDLLAQVDQLLL